MIKQNLLISGEKMLMSAVPHPWPVPKTPILNRVKLLTRNPAKLYLLKVIIEILEKGVEYESVKQHSVADMVISYLLFNLCFSVNKDCLKSRTCHF